MRYIIGLIAAVVAISLSDWLFFGVLFHDRYDKTPATWRTIPESRKIADSMSAATRSVGSPASRSRAPHTD